MLKYLLILFIGLIPGALFAQIPVDTTNVDIDTTGQKDLIDVARALFHPSLKHSKYGKYREKKEVYFTFLPLSTDVPGGSKALVTSTTAGFYMGARKTTYISTVLFTPYTNFKGRYGLPIHSSLWTDSNKYNIEGETYFLRYPADTWGLGGGQNENNKVVVNYDYIRFYQSVLRRIKPYLYVGVGYNLDYYVDVNTNNAVLSSFTDYKYGTGQNSNSVTTGVTVNILYDTRQNLFNPIPGSYMNLVYRHNAEFIGSADNAQSVYIDFRKYVSLNSAGLYKNLIAFWTYYWSTLTPGTPYLALPAIGMDPYNRSGRGIEQSRYRGNALFYFESEYRRDITQNGLFGFVIFANVNSATQPNGYHFEYLNPAAGGGLRIQLNKKSGTNFCVDYGFSRGYSNLILSLGEAF
jgi:Omp85 superfamily domain